SFTFNAAPGAAAPPSQTLTVTALASTSASAQVAEQGCTSNSWLTISPLGSFTASQTATTFTVSVNQSGIAGGTQCTGTISMFTSSGNQTLSVTLNVTSLTTSTPSLTFSASAFTFNAVAGAAT